jgi:hypothetical protein
LAQEETEDPLVLARTKFMRAIELKAAGDFSGALALFREVGQVKMTPQVRYHIASCEESLGRLVAAYGGYDLALKQGQGMPQDFIVEVEGAIERLDERIPKLVFERGAGADAATIELDGVVLGATSVGQEIPVDPGPHSISATAPGHKAFSLTVDAEESKTQAVEVVLLPEEQRVEVRPPAPPPPPKGYGPWPIIIGASGLGVAIVGAVLLPVSQANIGHAKELCNDSLDCSQPGISDADREEARNIVSSAQTVEVLGWSLLGVGLVATGVGTTLYLLDPARHSGQEPGAQGKGASNRSASPGRWTLGSGRLGSWALETSIPRADVGLGLSGTW